jgi:hypothetical protein
MNGPRASWPRRGVSTVAEMEIGAMSNSRSLVNDWRQAWVLWMGNYPMELMVCPIYRVRERWPVNWTKTRGGRRGRGALAQALSGFHRGSPSGDHQICLTRLTVTW